MNGQDVINRFREEIEKAFIVQLLEPEQHNLMVAIVDDIEGEYKASEDPLDELEVFLLAMKGRKENSPPYEGLEGELGVVNAVLKQLRSRKEYITIGPFPPIPKDISKENLEELQASVERDGVGLTKPELVINQKFVEGSIDQEIAKAIEDCKAAGAKLEHTIHRRMGLGVPKQ